MALTSIVCKIHILKQELQSSIFLAQQIQLIPWNKYNLKLYPNSQFPQ